MTNDRIDIDVSSGQGYTVWFDSISNLSFRVGEVGLPGGRCFIVTDENVAPLYLKSVCEVLGQGGWDCRNFVLPAGEKTKCLDHLASLYDWALGDRVERHHPVVALGGGVVGDTAGFLAATVLRGVPLVHVPTTLIAQVDSSIGGKTGINHAQGKNLIGAFYPPSLVLADPRTLDTLPEREWLCGLAEVLKHSLIRDEGLFRRLATDWESIVPADPDAVAGLVPEAAAVKAAIVEQDEFETGQRRLLNFGHTFGHALERTAGYEVIKHGEAVALGMCAALLISQNRRKNLEIVRIIEMIEALVPVELIELDVEEVLAAMKHDKKRHQDAHRIVLLEEIGSAYVADDVTDAELYQAVSQVLAH